MLYKQFKTPEYQWGIWEVSESLDELLALLPNGGEAYLSDLNRFSSDSRKIEWLAVRVLLYTLTGRVIPILYHPNWKPYVDNDALYLSISHTKGYVAVIISETNEVGIDIEQLGDRIHRLAHKFVRDDEPLPADWLQKTHALLLIWSAKEVMFKCMNQTAVDFREHLYVDINNLDGTYLLGRETRTQRGSTFRIPYLIDKAFVMTWSLVN